MDQDQVNPRSILDKYGIDSLSYFSLHEKKRFYFSSTGKSYLSYIIYNKTALVSCDPIGVHEDFPKLIEEFQYFLKGANLKCCFVGIHKDTLPLLRSFGHKSIHIGNEAILHLHKFDKKHLKKKVLRAEKHIKLLNIECVIYKRGEIPADYFQQLFQVSDEWLKQKGGRERGYSMTLGRIPNENDTDCEFVLGLQEGKVIGYLTFVPAHASKTLSLDASRRTSSSPNGLIEFLLLQAFEYYKQRGVETISLNFAAFYLGNSCEKSILSPIQAVAYSALRTLYKTSRLYSFNNKFLPEWKERYLTFEQHLYLPLHILAIAKAEL